MAGRTEVEDSCQRPRRRDGSDGLVLKLKERNLSKRTRLPESAWECPEERVNLGANESNSLDSFLSAKVATASCYRERESWPAPSQDVGQHAELRGFRVSAKSLSNSRVGSGDAER